MEGVSVGRIVHYVMEEGHQEAGHVRPAMIVALFEPQGGAAGMVQLQVFTDGSNDGEEAKSGIIWRTSIPFADQRVPEDQKFPWPGRTWHWPPRV